MSAEHKSTHSDGSKEWTFVEPSYFGHHKPPRIKCANCGRETYHTYHRVSSWHVIDGVSHPLHHARDYVAVILTEDGWHCRVCKHTWDSEFNEKGEDDEM